MSDPSADSTGPERVRGIHAATGVLRVLANAFVFLALFSLISLLLGESPRQSPDPRTELWFWSHYPVR